jgi:hypothetical protein
MMFFDQHNTVCKALGPYGNGVLTGTKASLIESLVAIEDSLLQLGRRLRTERWRAGAAGCR